MRKILPRSITPIHYTWDSGLQVHRECPFVKKYREKLLLVPLTLLFLARKPFSTEYLVLAKYEESDDAIVVLDDYCVPKQAVTAASVVSEIDCPIDYNVSIHRHPSGIDDFSATDWENIIQNNDVNLLIVDGIVSKAIIRKKMPCGEYLAFSVPSENIVYYISDSIGEEKRKAEELFLKIKSKISKIDKGWSKWSI